MDGACAKIAPLASLGWLLNARQPRLTSVSNEIEFPKKTIVFPEFQLRLHAPSIIYKSCKKQRMNTLIE